MVWCWFCFFNSNITTEFILKTMNRILFAFSILYIVWQWQRPLNWWWCLNKSNVKIIYVEKKFLRFQSAPFPHDIVQNWNLMIVIDWLFTKLTFFCKPFFCYRILSKLLFICIKHFCNQIVSGSEMKYYYENNFQFLFSLEKLYHSFLFQ